jgi:hypothetical protein
LASSVLVGLALTTRASLASAKDATLALSSRDLLASAAAHVAPPSAITFVAAVEACRHARHQMVDSSAHVPWRA